MQIVPYILNFCVKKELQIIILRMNITLLYQQFQTTERNTKFSKLGLILGVFFKKFMGKPIFKCFETKDYNLDEIIKINSIKIQPLVKVITNHVTKI